MKPDFRKVRYILADFFCAAFVWVVFFIFRKRILSEQGIVYDEYSKLLFGTIVIASFWIILYYVFGFYHNIYRKSRIKELLNLLHATFWGTIIIFLTTLLDDQGVTNYKSYYSTLTLYYGLQFFLASIVKLISISEIRKLVKNGVVSFNCLLIGSLEKVEKSMLELEKSNHLLGLNFVGYSSFEGKQSLTNSKGGLRYWGTLDNLPKIISRCHIERVIICIDPTEHLKIKEVTNELAGLGTKVSILPDLYQILIGSVKVEHVLGVPLIDIDHDLMPFWQIVLKRLIDIFVALFVMVFGFPFFLVFMLTTKATSSGPIFFRQERVGFNGRIFKIIKFRSMVVGAELEGPALATNNDTRVTSWGRFMRKMRIDELPQFWNVFVGDMSLVGPRPERQFFIDQITHFAPEYRHLHKVRPGITSLGQVKYGYAENIDQMLERLKYDLLYMENMSIANDLRILYFTVITVLSGKGK